ncbi:MAG: adenosylmethionine decarboxylase [Candidatus Melainabacteria bacterium]|nr:adenosylmethionine decarboxylase [Candidatus Melainabacteria bacterium]
MQTNNSKSHSKASATNCATQENQALEYEFGGRHLLASYLNCSSEALADAKAIDKAMREAIQASGATVLSVNEHLFEGGGMTALYLLSESHASIHTYPEHKSCFVDIFTCGYVCEPKEFDRVLREYFKPDESSMRYMDRGSVTKEMDSSDESIAIESNNIASWNKDGEKRKIFFQPHEMESFVVDEVLLDTKTKYQSVMVCDTAKYGRILVLDGDLQSAQNDEELYHEFLVHPAMMMHKDPKSVLIVGTGEGATIREAFKYKNNPDVTAVDIDQEVVEICRDYLPTWHRGALNADSKATLLYEDGLEYLRREKKTFDVIIMDVVSDHEEGPAEALYTAAFYNLVKTKLSPGGIVGIQGMYANSYPESRMHRKLRGAVESAFSQVHTYSTFVPSFWAEWGYLLASDWCNPTESGLDMLETLKTRFKERVSSDAMVHLTPELLLGSFAQSKANRKALGIK